MSKKLLKKWFIWEEKLEELVFDMVIENEDEDSLKYAIKILKDKLDSIFEDEDE